ncbi:MAG TPA: hypothetical protein VMG58_14370 [Candidatus Sulfotelmatobacter sp.]|nr:hypothetical protein [Candidatus Sulfotelmatobacter sp.]
MESARSIASPRRPESDPLLVVKRFDAPETVLSFDQGRLGLVRLDGHLIGRGTYRPGWRWSQVSGPARRAGERPLAQTGFILAGRAKIQIPERGDVDLFPGDLFHVAAEYESWVVGYRPCEILYLDGMEDLLERLHRERAAHL